MGQPEAPQPAGAQPTASVQPEGPEAPPPPQHLGGTQPAAQLGQPEPAKPAEKKPLELLLEAFDGPRPAEQP